MKLTNKECDFVIWIQRFDLKILIQQWYVLKNRNYVLSFIIYLCKQLIFMSILSDYTIFIHVLHTLVISFEEGSLDRLIFNYLHKVLYAYNGNIY